MEGEEARAGEERERDEQHAGVASPAGGSAMRRPEQEAEERRDEHEPEVGRLVLPGDVQVGDAEEEEEPGERNGEEAGRDRGPAHRRARSSRS